MHVTESHTEAVARKGHSRPKPATPRSRLEDRAKVFTVGAAYGFLAGIFVMGWIVWQFGDLGERRSTHVAAAKKATVSEQPVDDTGAPDPPRMAAPSVGTTGPPPVAASPTMSAPPGRELETRDLLIPVEGIGPGQLTRQFDDPRGGRRHEAIDILAPRGTPVRAVEDGRIARLYMSKAGGITVYQFDPTERFCYYYAHLDRYAAGLRENDTVWKGQTIGYVGTTGNAPPNTPHLHFAVFWLNAQKRWWEGTPLDPYDILR